MSRKRARNITLKILLHLIIIHTVFSAVFAMLFNYIHPFTNFTKGFPVWLQASILSLVGLIFYLILGTLYAAIKPNKKSLRVGIERSVIYFTLGMMAVYAVVYFIAQEFHNIDYMLIYCIVNPWFGTFIYRVPVENIYSLWWMMGTVVPGLGMYLGSRSYLKKQGV